MTAMRLKRYSSPSGVFALGKMGVGATMLNQGKTARDYVQDGLVAMWDGIENAGWGVHDANATVWKDLIGTTDFFLSPSWAHFDANSYSSDLSSSSLSPETSASADANLSTSSIKHVECVFRIRSYIYATETIILNPNSRDMSLIYAGWKNQVGVGNSRGNQTNCVIPGAKCAISVGSGDGQNIGVINGTSWTYYSTTSLSPNGQQGKLLIGGRLGGTTRKLDGNIYCIRLYSRALTADEIAANYAIDKERFNLP